MHLTGLGQAGNPISWWGHKNQTRNLSLRLQRLIIDFTKEKYGGGGRI
tara:strand:+ start:333 stop:476 length:144 start_codon:yes stop_codon:yes gene_type:complete